jgi:iron complex outermembrane recepter protein
VKKTRLSNLKSTTAPLVLGLAMISMPAFAQEAEEEAAEEAIIVTGSRIARPNDTSSSPVTVVSGEQTTANADVTLETFLNTLPGVNPAGTTTSNNPGNNGQANINLRGLGTNRNPMVSANTLVVDLNTIPAALIDRIDIITGGAGATYGADAIAGVTNLILKKDFEGVDARATYTNTAKTDAEEFNASLTLGGNFADGKGNAVFAFDYTQREGLIKSQRPFAAIATSTTTFLPEGFYAPGTNAPTPAAVNALFATYGVAAGAVDATQGLGFNTDRTLFGVGVFNNPLNVQNFRYPVDLSVNLNLFPDLYSYNFDEVNLLVLPLKRKSAMAKINYEINPAFEVFGQFGWTDYKSVTALAPTPVPTVTYRNPTDPARLVSNALSNLVVSGQSVANFLIVPVTNPFVPADLLTLLNSRTGDNAALVGTGATEPFLMRSRTLGAGARTSTFTNEVIQYMAGLRGEFAPNWRYEAYYSEGDTEITNDGAGAIDTQRLQNLLEAADGGNSLCAGGFNPFGRNPLSAACITYLGVATKSITDLKQRIAQAFITGEFGELPGGPIGVAFGAELRKFDYAVDPGALSGPISGPNVVNRAAGKNSFRDFFAEVRLPIASGSPWADSLELNLGWRMSKFKSTNTLNGAQGAPSTDHTYKAELSWAPIPEVRMRGSFQRAVRAPNFGELFAGGGSAPQYYDPCSVNSQFRQGNLGATAAQALNLCQFGNRTVGGVSAAAFANYVQPPGSQLTINLVGNPAVRPEKSDSFTFGIVAGPPSGSGIFSRLRGSLDYYNIKVNDAIVTPDPNSVLAACFNYLGTNPTFDPTNASCQSLVRQGAQLAQILNPAVTPAANFAVNNLAQIKTSGIDAQLNWPIPLEGLGENATLTFDMFANYLIEWKLRDGIPGLPSLDYAGTVSYFGAGLGTSFPRWRGSLSTTLTVDEFSFNLRSRYIHSMKNRAALQYAGEEASFTGVGSVWYFDAAATVNVENLTFRLGVNNLFNRQPETYAPNVQSGTDPSLYDVIGRRFFVSAGLRF